MHLKCTYRPRQGCIFAHQIFMVKLKPFFFFVWQKRSRSVDPNPSPCIHFFSPNKSFSPPLTTTHHKGQRKRERQVCLGQTKFSSYLLGLCAWDTCLWAKNPTTISPLFTSSKAYPEFPVVSFPAKILLAWEGDSKHSHWLSFTHPLWSTVPLAPLSECLQWDLLSPGYIIFGLVNLYNYFLHSFVCERIHVGSFYTRVHMEARCVHMEHVFFCALMLSVAFEKAG